MAGHIPVGLDRQRGERAAGRTIQRPHRFKIRDTIAVVFPADKDIAVGGDVHARVLDRAVEAGVKPVLVGVHVKRA